MQARKLKMAKPCNMNRDNVMNDIHLVGVNKDKIVKIYRFGHEVTFLNDDGDIYHVEFGDCKKISKRKFKDFVIYFNNILAISSKSFLFLNKFSCPTFGPGSKIFQGFEPVKPLWGIAFVKIAIGNGRFFAQAQDGKFYEWGARFRCFDSIGSTCDVKLQEDDMAVKSILYPTDYPIVLTRNGKVFLPVVSQVRKNSFDFLYEKLQLFEDALKEKKVNMIETGKKFIFALTDEGEIYMWNKGKEFQSTPQRINYNCNGFLGRNIRAADEVELLAVLGECGSLISLRLSDAGQLVSISTFCYKSAYDFFKDLEIPYNGCLYDGICKTEENLKLKYMWQKNFENIFNIQDDSDVSIEVEGKTIYCHKIILNAQCPYLRKMLEYELANKDRICIEDFSYEVFSSFLKYIYTGRLEIQSYKNNLDLIELAHRYGEAELLKYCEVQAIKGLSLESALEVKKLATLLELEDLIAACNQLILG